MILAGDNLALILTSRGPKLATRTPASENPTPRLSAPTSGSGAASPVTPRFPASHDTEARDLVALYAERRRLTHELAQSERPTSDMVQAVFAKGDELRDACEAFRRRYYRRAGRVFVGGYTVLVASPAGRRHRTVYDGTAEFRFPAEGAS